MKLIIRSELSFQRRYTIVFSRFNRAKRPNNKISIEENKYFYIYLYFFCFDFFDISDHLINDLEQINENTFNNLRSLKELYFHNTTIETNEKQFSNLVNLEWMTLSTQNDIDLKEMLYLLF